MDMMRYLRKHKQKIMIVVVFFVAVMFGIPSILNQLARRKNSDQVMGFYTDSNGDKKAVGTLEIGGADSDLNILRSLGIDQIARGLAFAGLQQPEAGGSSYIPELAVHQLLFADSSSRKMVRAELIRRMAGLGDMVGESVLEKVFADIDAIAAEDAVRGRLYYLLLVNEAHEAGIRATHEQVSDLLKWRKQLMMQGMQGMSLEALQNSMNISESRLLSAVANYISIIRYAHSLTRPMALTEPELKTLIQKRIDVEKTEGTFVAFDTSMLRVKAGEPTDVELQELFDKYRTAEPGAGGDDNPFGLGYKLSDRVKVEYIKADVAQLKQTCTADFEGLPIGEQEDLIQQYWADNQAEFTEQVKPAEGVEDAQPEYRVKSFDEVADQARDSYLQKQAEDKALQVLAEAKRMSVGALGELAAREAKYKDRVKAAADYDGITKELTSTEVPLSYGLSNYLTPASAQGFQGFGQTYVVKNGRAVQSVLALMFQCEPLMDSKVDERLRDEMVRLLDDIGPVLTLDYSGNANAAYLVRVVDAEKQRDPVSMVDDGSYGAAENVPADAEGGAIHKQLVQDWKRLRNYELVQAKAREFAAQAGEDWDKAFEATNADFNSDPNNPIRPLSLRQVQSLRDDMQRYQEQYQKMAQQNQGSASYYARIIQQRMQTVMEVAEYAREHNGQVVEGLAVVPMALDSSCLVFKELKSPVFEEAEYLKRKPMVSRELVIRNQQVMALDYFNPENIKTRMGFEFKHSEQAKDEESDEAAAGEAETAG